MGGDEGTHHALTIETVNLRWKGSIYS